MKAATGQVRAVGVSQKISIHAAREGGDQTVKVKAVDADISIHAAREGGD